MFEFDAGPAFPWNDVIDTVGSTGEEQSEVARYCNIKRQFVSVYASVLFIVGVPGNVITLMVLMGQSLKDKFLPTLLFIESIANLLDLIINLGIYWIAAVFHVDVRNETEIGCTIYLVFFFTNHMVIIWMLVVVTTTRYYYMGWPDTAPKKCTKRLAYKIGAALILFMLTFNSIMVLILTVDPGTEATKLQTRECRAESEEMAIVHSVMLFYLPLLIQVTMLVLLHKYYKRMSAGSTMSVLSKKNAGRQVVFVTFVSTVQFIITVGPYAVYFHAMYHWFDATSPVDLMKMTLGYTVCLMAVYTNYAINFFVYYFIGQRFRNECRHLGNTWWNKLMSRMGRFKESVEISPVPSHTEETDEEGLIKRKLKAIPSAVRMDGKLSIGLTTFWSQDKRTNLIKATGHGGALDQMNKMEEDLQLRNERLLDYQASRAEANRNPSLGSTFGKATERIRQSIMSLAGKK